MFTVNEMTIYRWITSDKDVPVMIFCLIAALVVMPIIFGFWALGCCFVGMGFGGSAVLLYQDYQEYKRDQEFRFEFDNWEGNTWTRDTYHQ